MLSVSKTDGTTKGDAEDLDLVMPMYNLLKCCSNYSDAICSLWFYLKDEATNFNANILINSNSKSFKYKTISMRNLNEMERGEF